MFREKGRPEMAKYLKKLREQAIIEWKNDELQEGLRGATSRARPTPTTQLELSPHR